MENDKQEQDWRQRHQLVNWMRKGDTEAGQWKYIQVLDFERDLGPVVVSLW